MSVEWTTKWRWDTVYCADSVEWCPVEGYWQVLVCGTYQLDKECSDSKSKQKRVGRIYLFIIDDKTKELAPVQTIDTSGVLDQKWSYHEICDHPVLAVATSDGKLQLYKLIKNDESKFKLELWLDHSIGQDVLALSLDWSTNKIFYLPKIAVSDSSGCVTVFQLIADSLVKVGTWKGHGFEAWITAYSYMMQDIFYSGGDDCVFKCYDLRVPDAAVLTNRSHEAGVTAIRSHMDYEHYLLTGSYDEKVRLWDPRSFKSPVMETDVNGGVWRLKWHPSECGVFLAACMYGGFRVVRVEGFLYVVKEYNEHESIAYGADWNFDNKRPLVATCSFYDCKMHISDVEV